MSSDRSTPMAAAELLGVELVHDGADEVRCRLTVAEQHLNQGLIGHGGVLFVLADTALGLLANPPEVTVPWVGTSFAVSLVRGVAVGEVVTATAHDEHRSARLRVLVARLTRGADLIGTVTAQLVPGRATAPTHADPEPRAADPTAPLPRALRAAADREGTAGREVTAVLYEGEQPVGFDDGEHRWLHPRWRG